MKGIYVQFPYPGDLVADLHRDNPDVIVLQNPLNPATGTLYAQAVTVGTAFPDRVIFVGSVAQPPFTGSTSVPMPSWATHSPFVGAMTNNAYRWQLIRNARDAWGEWKDRFGPGFGFYLSQEANLCTWAGYDWSEPVRAGYEAVIVQAMRDATEIDPYARVLWSPYCYDKFSTVPFGRTLEVSAAYEKTITKATSWLKTHDLLELWMSVELQDGVGAGAARGITMQDAVGWAKRLGIGAINLELFDGNRKPIGMAEEMTRLAYYITHQLRVGACFELRYAA